MPSPSQTRYLSVVNNSTCPIFRRSDIVSTSSCTTPSFNNRYNSKEAALLWSSYNWTRKLCILTTERKHTNISLPILLLLLSLVCFSTYPTKAFTMDPTLIFVLICFLSFLYFIVVITCKIMVDLGVEGNYLVISNSTVDFFCVKSNSNKKQNPTKHSHDLRSDYSSLRE